MRSNSFSNGFVWPGVLVAVLSSVKALNTFIEFGFSGIWADVLGYYARTTEPIRLLASNIPFLADAPNWLLDVLLLYVVLVMTGLRSTVLPYRYDDYYKMHNTRRTYEVEFPRRTNENLDEFINRQEEFNRERMITAATLDDKFVVRLQEIFPRWELILYQSIKCLTLLPVITLEPFRKMDNSIGFVRKLLRKADLDDQMIEYNHNGRKGFYAKWALEVDKIRFDGFLQIVSLPVLVALFLLGATYIK